MKFTKVNSKAILSLYKMVKYSNKKHRYVGSTVTEYNKIIYNIFRSNIRDKDYFLLLCRNDFINRVMNRCVILNSVEQNYLKNYICAVYRARYKDAKR